jgi:diguanylate cyclase (GGDEF)-like protein
MKNSREKSTKVGASECESPAVLGDDRKIRNIRILLVVVVLVGVISVLAPEIYGQSRVEIGFVPQLLIGLAALVLMFNLHLASQRKLLREFSTALSAATSYVDRLEQYSLIDPETQLFNRKYLDQLFNQQMRLLNRIGKPATMLLFEVLEEGQESAEAEMIVEAAFVLRSNFRGSDYVVRDAVDKFLVLLPDTTEEQAQFALDRLTDKLENWNLENTTSEMVLRHQLRVCPPGENFWEKFREMEKPQEKPVPPSDRADSAEARGSGSAAAMSLTNDSPAPIPDPSPFRRSST